MLKVYKKYVLFVATLVVLLLISTKAFAQQPEQPLQQTIEQIEATGQFNFIAQIEQTLIPKAVPSNFGTTEERYDSQMRGEVILPDYARVDLQFEAGGEMPPLTIEQTGSASYLIQNGERIEIENPLDVTPTTDFIGFLNAAENVRLKENGEQPQLTTYEFEVNGEKFSEYLLQQLRQQLPADQRHDPILIPSNMGEMQGHGEIWVDADGYPQRQILDIYTPNVNEQYDAQVRMVIDYRWETAVTNLPLPTTENVPVVPPAAIQPSANNASTTASATSLLTLLQATLILALVAACAFAIARSPRWLRRAVPITITVLLIATPILQPISQAQALKNHESSAPPSLFEALGVSDEADEASEAELADPIHMAPTVPVREQNLVDDLTCGSADPNADLDQDGLNDFVETCLGTDPYYFDTDEDGITDTLEVNGFVFTDTLGTLTTFYSNPHEADTNLDGLHDLEEWPEPVGNAPSIDPDGDAIPNLWDDDNDGDGIPDGVDMDPFTATAYQSEFSLQTGLNGSSFDGYQYIEFQVQPQNESHLRLALTELDWPYDDVGTIQAHDVAKTDELSFSPILKVTANQAPYEDMRAPYGIVAAKNGSVYEMQINLFPVVDGGHITAFQGRVAYPPQQLNDINWSKIELGWIAYMDNSQTVNGESVTSRIPVAEYIESNFRFAGLKITKSGSTKYAAIGTPNAQTDHRQLANILLGLEATYLSAVSPNFDEIVTRFTTSSTPTTETWGIPATDIAVAVPDFQPLHLDHVFQRYANSAAVIRELLNDNNYDKNKLASIITAMEAKIGSESLDTTTALSGNQFTFNLADIPVATMRTVNLAHYTHENNVWGTPNDVEAINTLLATYNNDPDVILADLQTNYPDLTQADLITVLSGFYGTWMAGQSEMIDLDGVAVVRDTVSDEVVNEYVDLTETDLVSYIIDAYQLAVVNAGLAVTDRDSYYKYRNTRTGAGYFIVGKFITVLWQIRKGIIIYNKIKQGNALYIRSFEYSVNGWLKTFQSIQDAGFNVSQKLKASGWKKTSKFVYKHFSKKYGRSSDTMLKLAKKYTKIGYAITAIAFAVSMTLIWTTYAKYDSLYDYEEEYALAYAIVDTVLTTIFTIMAFTGGVGVIIFFLFVVIDLIVYAITAILGEGIDSIVTTAITKLFADIRPYAEYHSADFTGLDLDPSYAVAGGTFTISDVFDGWLIASHGNDLEQVRQSKIEGFFRAQAGSGIETDTDSYDLACAPWTNPNGVHFQNCTNGLSADYVFDNAGRDQKIEFMYTMRAETRYVHYSLGGLISKDKTNILDLPDDIPPPQKRKNKKKEDPDLRWGFSTFYVDVLPNTLDGVLNWNELFNYDLDGDDVDNITEAVLSTIPPIYPNDIDGDGLINGRDWDRDGDTLSDGFETATQNGIGANPNINDSDADGLHDGIEYRLGTSISLTDHDSDGLTDGEEWFHWDGSAWSGGGWFVTIDGVAYWVFATPFAADSDNDGIPDGSEKLNGTSPYAANDAPQLQLDAGPLFENADGLDGIYVRAGDTVTTSLSLHHTGSFPITTTLSLCLPASLSSVTVNASGDRVPTTQTNGSCYDWDFSGNNLLPFQRFNVDVSAVAGNGTSSDVIKAELPYATNGAPQPLSDQVLYVEDNTKPTLQISDPLADDILSSQFYVIGGYAQDTNSWIDHVDVTVPAGTFTADLADSQWGYTWELPDDGVIDITAVSYDLVGNASDPVTVQVTVDTLAPTLTVNVADGQTISASESLSTTLTLDGTVTDNFAGIARVQLRYNEGIWRTIWDDDTNPLSANWSGLWELPTVDTAQGEHTIYLRAYDAYGNVNTISRTIFIDVLPPTNELTNRAFVQEAPKHVPGGQAVPLYGVASDAGNNLLPADPADLSGDLHSITDATVWLQVDSLDENDSGAFVTWLGDNNGDRLGDLAIGLPAANGGTGKVVVVNGSPGDWPIPNIGELEFLLDNTPSYIGTTGAGIGAIIQAAGDVNGDGVDDMLVGDPANERVMLILGSPTASPFQQPLDGTAPRQIEIVTDVAGETMSGLTAVQVAGVGDVTNDGLSDIMISVTDGAAGNVYLLAGSTLLTSPQTLNTIGAAVLATGAAGASVAGVGDVNDDFITDFAVAIDGTVYLFAGGGGWVQGGQTALNTANALATFATADSLPTIVGAGDVNGDGIDDFAFSSGSTPVVVMGNASNSFSTQTLNGFASPLSGFLAAVGDVDEDGRGDLLVGNDDDDAYLLLGSDLNSVAATLEGVATAASAPYVAGADLAGDGSSDLAVVPTAAAAQALGYDGFGGQALKAPFINRSWLPQSAGATAVSQPNLNSTQSIGKRSAAMTGDVTVAPVGGDFTSIQAAIDSGASRVLIQPGIYAETITLANNVTIIGSGADRTVLTFPSGGATTLVTADGVTNAAVLNLTLLGDGSGTGLAAVNNATNIRLERAVVQGFTTAVSVDSSATTLALKNNTVVGNTAGFVASGNAGVDIRNTIFAFNTGTAVQYDGGAVQQLHQYNLYYANGTDLSPNNPGGGELFSNPLFLDYGAGDFRTESFSPVIDAGTPNDPVPPGAGTAVDIGHMEQTGSSFFADDDYCDVCLNDGLLWEVDAFATIQEAVDAAQDDITNLTAATPIQFTVGVNDGTYAESIVINTSVKLIGRGADLTTIQGNGGPAVTFNEAVNAGVSGFTLTGGGGSPVGILLQGGSNTIAIEYNHITANTAGIHVTERSTGTATFNTITANTTGVELAQGTFFNTYAGGERLLEDSCNGSATLCEERGFLWLDLSHSIISGNANGLVAIGKSVLFSDFNLLFNTTDYTNVVAGRNDITGQDPLLVAPHGYLQASSPAVDKGDPTYPIPAGGGLRPDLGWHELLAAPVSIFMGRPDESLATESIGVGQVEYAVVAVPDPTTPISETLPSSWTVATLDNPNEKLTYWQADFTPTTDGYYRLYSRASDVLGNTETADGAWYDGAFVVDSNAPVVTMNITSYSGLGNWLLVEAEVVDYIGNSFDIDEIYFMIDGERVEGRWNIEQWTPDGSSPRTFRHFFQNNTGMDLIGIDFQAFAIDGAGNVGSSAVETRTVQGDFSSQWIDITPPDWITVTNPLPGTYVAGTVMFTGQAFDSSAILAGAPNHDSGTNGIELSFDGGVTWEVANSWNPNLPFGHDREWEYEWTVPTGLDATTIPVRVRATDNAGNFRSETIMVTLDTAPPRSFKPVTFNYPIGVFLDAGEEIIGTWNASLDGSGWTEGTLVAENMDGTLTLTPHASRQVSAFGSEGVPVEFTFGEVDEAGNVIYDDFGIWNAGDVALGTQWNGFQRLIRDGNMEIDRDEWLRDTEFLDDDERPFRTQNLWVTWDNLYSFIGWQGASWGSDGTMWAYYDVVAGGSNIGIADGRQLPFAADFAVSAVDADTAFLWTYQAGSDSWTSEQLSTPATNQFEPEYGHNPDTEETEIRVFFDFLNTGTSTSWNRMFAYATDTNGDVWSAFPTVNELDGPFDYFYEWNKANGTFYLLDLPESAHKPAVAMSVVADPPVQDTVSTDETVTYTVALINLENEDEAGIQLLLDATAGLTYQTVTGATAHDCAGATSCTIDLPTIVSGAAHEVVITAVLANDLTSIVDVTTAIHAQNDIPLADTTFALTHNVDIDPPTVIINPYPANVVATGTEIVGGFADDGEGAGVALVEVSSDGTNWQTADGLQVWQLEIPTPGLPTWTFYARATDYHGQTSTPVQVTMISDLSGPLLTPNVPALISGLGFYHFDGTTKDEIPPGARVQSIEMQLDSASADWTNGTVYRGFLNSGEQTWSLPWYLPIEDGVQHTVRFRATDYAGNETISDWFTTTVDTVPPALVVTEHRTQVGVSGNIAALSGTVTDGYGVNDVRVLIYPTSGAAIETTATIQGNDWSVVLSQPLGHYQIHLIASDLAGNTRRLGPFAVEVVTTAGPTSPDVGVAIDNGLDILLTWTPDNTNNCGYGVYRNVSPYFTAATAQTTLDDTLAAGTGQYSALGDADDGINYFYLVTASDCIGGSTTAQSNETAIFHFDIVPGSP